MVKRSEKLFKIIFLINKKKVLPEFYPGKTSQEAINLFKYAHKQKKIKIVRWEEMS